MQPFHLDLDSRHLNIPATAILIAYHPKQDISVIFLRGKYLLSIDGSYYMATCSSTTNRLGRQLVAAGDEARTLLPHLFPQLRKERVFKEMRRGHCPSHVNGVPAEAFVLWSHPRADLCLYDLYDKGHHEYICWRSQRYAKGPNDRIHVAEEYTALEVSEYMAKVLQGRVEYVSVDTTALDQLLA